MVEGRGVVHELQGPQEDVEESCPVSGASWVPLAAATEGSEECKGVRSVEDVLEGCSAVVFQLVGGKRGARDDTSAHVH